MIKGLWISLLLLFASFHAFSQTVDQDSTALPQPKFDQKLLRQPLPKKALTLSLILPGAGQAYNGRLWKLPLVYGAIGGMVYVIDFNQSRFKRLQTALDLKRQNLPHEFSGTGIDNERSLLALRDSYDKNRQLSYFGLFVVYALQGVEAFVDAHLQGFEINEDLSLIIRPQLQPGPAAQSFSLQPGLQLVLQKRKN